MDNNIPKDKHLTVTLEKTSSAQNTCFWEAIAVPDGLEIRWGIYGTKGSSRIIPAKNCSGRNPARELQKRVNEKLSGAYKLTDYDCITM